MDSENIYDIDCVTGRPTSPPRPVIRRAARVPPFVGRVVPPPQPYRGRVVPPPQPFRGRVVPPPQPHIRQTNVLFAPNGDAVLPLRRYPPNIVVFHGPFTQTDFNSGDHGRNRPHQS